jgi:hypothetical protein
MVVNSIALHDCLADGFGSIAGITLGLHGRLGLIYAMLAVGYLVTLYALRGEKTYRQEYKHNYRSNSHSCKGGYHLGTTSQVNLLNLFKK